MELAQRGLSKKTINYHIIAVRAFLKFLSRNDIPALAPEKLELAKTPPRTVAHLTTEEVQKLLDLPMEIEKNPVKALRDQAILYTLFGTGLRVTELIGLKKDTLQEDSHQFFVIGK